MADYITRILTNEGEKQIDYNALANLPTHEINFEYLCDERLTVPAGTVNLDTGVSLKDLSVYDKFYLGLYCVAEPWINFDLNVWIQYSSQNIIYGSSNSGHQYVFTRLAQGVNCFEVIGKSRANANNTSNPPALNTMYDTGGLSFGFADVKNRDENFTINFKIPSQTKDVTLRMVVGGILKKVEVSE